MRIGKRGEDMKSVFKLFLITIAFTSFSPDINAFSQTDDFASGKKSKIIPKDNMPVIKPESDDSIPVIHPDSKDKIPTINPDTASKLIPNNNIIINPQKKKTYRNSYNYPSRGNHFGDNRIGSMVGQSDTRRKRKRAALQ
jgi:hypothetical protein